MNRFLMKLFAHFIPALVVALALSVQAGAPEVHRYQGKVLDTQGQPVPGAKVECYRGPASPYDFHDGLQLSEEQMADAQGRVTFAATNLGFYMLVASKPGLSLAWNVWHLQRDTEEVSDEFVLTPPAAVSGTVQDADGKPVSGAEIWVSLAQRPGKANVVRHTLNLFYSQEGRKYLAARSGAAGEFRINGLPADAALELAAARPGLALEQPQSRNFGMPDFSFHAGQSNIVLALKPTGALAGRVVREGSGAPVAGARVALLASWFSGGTPPATTGPDGTFRLGELAPGEYALRATIGTNQFPEWVCDTVNASVTAGATNHPVEITASRGAVLEATVHDSAERPLEDVSVSTYGTSAARYSSTTQPAATSTEGQARLRLVPGSYRLSVSKEGLRSYQTQLELEPGQTNRQTVTLEPAPQLTGTVLDPEGKPAAKVSMLLFPFSRGEKQSDAQGRFTLTSDAGMYGGMQGRAQNLIARDSTRNLATSTQVEEGTTNVTLKLEPGVTLTGRITDPDGHPIPNAQVTVMVQFDRSSSTVGAPAGVDAQGRFELIALPSGRSYSVRATASGFGQARRRLEAPAADSRRVELEPFQLPVANLRLAGVVLDAEDKPVASATVWTPYEGDQPQLHGQTDAKGRFAFEHVCAGSIHLYANLLNSAHGEVTAEGGDTNVTIRFQEAQRSARAAGSARLSGTVVDPDGKPAPKITLYLFPHAQRAGQTDAQGHFNINSDALQYAGRNANQRILLACDPARNLATALELEPEATNASLKLEPGWTAAGKVTDLDGKPLTNAQAQLVFWSGSMGTWIGSPARADAQGRFEINGLAPGQRYSVDVTAKGYGRETQKPDAPEAGARRVELDPFQLPVADQRVAGVVLNANDEPVAYASVYCYGQKQPNINTQTDSKGRFSLESVCAGPIRLSSSDPNGGFGSASAQGGDTNVTIHFGASPSGRVHETRPAGLKGKPLPDLASLGLTAADVPAGQPLLVVLIDAEQRPSRRTLRLLAEQAPALKQKGLAVIVLQTGEMAGDALTAWKKEAALPFPLASCPGNSAKVRAAWGAAALPWLVLADKTHRVIAEGFPPEELDSHLKP